MDEVHANNANPRQNHRHARQPSHVPTVRMSFRGCFVNGFATRACIGAVHAKFEKVFYLATACALGQVAFANGVVPPVSAPEHKNARGFFNNYAPAIDKPLKDVIEWQWNAWRDGLPKQPRSRTPTQTPDLRLIQGYARNTSELSPPMVTWIGHATSLVQFSGLNVLTDPIFSERAAPVQFFGPKRMQPPGVALVDLPPIDVVLISHNHFDHLDRNTILSLLTARPDATLFIVPLGLKVWMHEAGVRHVVELDWWECVTTWRDPHGKLQWAKKPVPSTVTASTPGSAAVDFYLTPVQHWSARSVGDRNQTLWGGWAVFGPEFHWYFSGDSGYSPDFKDTRRRFARPNVPGFDLSLIAIGAYEPRAFMKDQHLNPAEAIQAHLDLASQRSIGIHWGTFNLTDEPPDQPPLDLEIARRDAGLSEQDFSVMKIGETRVFAKRLPLQSDRRHP